MRTPFTTLATVAVLSLATACGGTQQSATPNSTTTPPPSTAMAPPASSTRDPSSTAPQPSACASTASWGTGAREAAGSTTDALYLVRTGRHDCYDRVVFDINGPSDVGFSVRYVPEVTADATGTPIPVGGGAALQVVVRAPEQGFDNSGPPPATTSTPRRNSPAGQRYEPCVSPDSSRVNAPSPLASGRRCHSVLSPCSTRRTRSGVSWSTSRIEEEPWND